MIRRKLSPRPSDRRNASLALLVVEQPHGDAGDARLRRFEGGVTFGERPDGGELLVAQLIDQEREPVRPRGSGRLML